MPERIFVLSSFLVSRSAKREDDMFDFIRMIGERLEALLGGFYERKAVRGER